MAEHSRSGDIAHPAPDDLAVLALDRQAPDAGVREHLAACPACAGQYDAFRATTERIHRSLRHDGERHGAVTPPLPRPDEALWHRIAAEVDAGSPERSAAVPTASVTPLRRRVRPAWLAVAAGVVVLAVAAAALTGVLRPAPDIATVAATDLAPLAEDRAPAVAALQDQEGTITLALDLPAEEDTGTSAYYELWLIDENVEGMVSLGPVRAGSSRVPVPAGLDVSRFPIVDVSREPFDGDPRHSGDSLWRGQLDA